MNRDQVVNVLGGSYTVVGARQDPDGAVEILRFGDREREQLFTFFREGRLVQWGDHEMLQQAPAAR